MYSKDRGRTSKYEQLRLDCLREGKLFEDPDFPANNRSLYSKNPKVHIEWKRPGEICQNPKFFSDGADRHDVAQGNLQNCWLVSAISSLSQYKSLLYRVCPPHQTFRKDHYCGLFVFRFWRFGEWIEVIVDDRLPTYKGQLYYAKSTDPNEFWCSLVEKAYCKLYGSYESLAYGVQNEALQDFTGGLVDKIKLSDPPKNVFDFLSKEVQRHSLLGASLAPKSGVYNLRQPNGLITGHAYSVTGIRKIELPNFPDRPTIHLIRLRNPWGNNAEWKGAWSDRSPQWKMLSARQKLQLDLTFEDDGEFWMDFQDFMRSFSLIEICMLTPDSVSDEHKKKWELRIETGRWQAGVNAGGRRNHIKYFDRNPQIRVRLEEPDDDSEGDLCSVVIALMRKDKRRHQQNVPIGFAVYKVPSNLGKQQRLDRTFFEYNHAVAKTNVFTTEREIILRCLLVRGEYIIVPSTYEPNQQADFLLRIFAEKSHDIKEVDQRTEVIGPTRPKPSNFDRMKFEDMYRKFFLDIAGEEAVVDQHDLQLLLNQSFSNDSSFLMFSLETCRSMISLFDYNKTGVLEYEEFVELWMLIKTWKRHFQYYDTENIGEMGTYELRDALKALNFKLSNRSLEIIVLRFHNKRGVISFDMFVQINVRLVLMFECFLRRSRTSRTGKAVFSMDDFIMATLCI